MPPDVRREGDKLVVNSVVIALVITIIVGIVLLLIINVIEFICYIHHAYRIMKRIDQDVWEIFDSASELGLTPDELRSLYDKFCEVRSLWRSLINRTK